MTQTVAEHVINGLIKAGMDQLYCLPGVQNDNFFDALYDYQDQLTPIHTRHEQGAAYMALGAALATGKPQVFCVVPGPGFLNAAAALATAYALNVPLLALVGQIPSTAIGQRTGQLHEIPDQLAILRGLTKSADRIERGAEAAEKFAAALAALTSGRPRPVGLEVPVDVWRQLVPDAPSVLPVSAQPALPKVEIEQALALLRRAERPLIVVGGGAQSLSAEVTALAEATGAAVIANRSGHGILPTAHPQSVNLPTGHALWAASDLVLGIGTRLQAIRNWGRDDAMKIIHIDIDPQAFGPMGKLDLAINADARLAVPQLSAGLADGAAGQSAWLTQIASVKAKVLARMSKRLAPQLAWLDVIRAAMPDDGIFVDEFTQIGYVARIAFEARQPRTYLSAGYQGTLGWGIATGLGAAHARRDVPVVSISGDGGALFAIGELASAKQHNIPLTMIIFNDNAYGNVRRFQIDTYNNRPIASDLCNPDFVQLAQSFGLQAVRATTPEALDVSLRAGIAARLPNLIEVPVGIFPAPWEFITLPKQRGVSRDKIRADGSFSTNPSKTGAWVK